MNNEFTAKLGKISEKASKNKVIQGLSNGVMGAFPLIVVGAFASLFNGLRIPAWQTFIHQTGVADSLSMITNATTNFLGVLVAMTCAASFAEQYEVKYKHIGLLSLMFYMILLPTYMMKKGTVAYLAYDYLGPAGMITAIIGAWTVVKLYKFVVNDHNWTIKMPEGTPPYVSNSFSALIPGFVIAIVALILRLIFLLTPFKSAFDLIYFVLQTPLNAIIGNNIWSIALINLIIQLVWVFGIHPGFIQSLLGTILIQLDTVNQAAYAAGKTLPNIIGLAFSYSLGVAVFYPALAVAVWIFARSKRLTTSAKISIVPAIFGISEPMNFGFPIIFNPILAIPYVIVPVLNLLIGYYTIKLGIVAHYAGILVMNIPLGFTGIINGSVSIAIMEVALFVLDILLCMPFIKVYDRTILVEEEQAKNNN